MAFDYSTIATDARAAEALSAEYLLLLADRNALPQHPALMYAGDASGSGSATIKIPHLGLEGYDTMASTGDGSTVSATDLTDAHTDVTVARYSLRRSPTDLARMTGPAGQFSPSVFAQDMFQAANGRLVSLVAALGDGFSNTIGTSGSNLTYAQFLAAKAELEISDVQGPYMAILHPRQWADLRADVATNAGGSIAFDPASPEMIRVMGQGYVGNYAGVDVFVTSRVPTANASADRAGCMFGRGAVVWADATPALDDPSSQILLGNKVLFEQDRDAAAGITEFVGHYYVGVAEGIDAAGVGIITDA